ncbi:sugar porter family MFS transporter [Actinomadura fulvescens]|uniref:Sugar porter family MFS transporter n=2 Tax=Actinomadura fulvescens TaxID=46160 RepID=A0ABN3QVF8_9ACTN
MRLYFWATVITLGGFLFGYQTGVVSGALLFVREDFDLGSVAQGAVVSVLLLGAAVGALAAGRLADRLGRRPTMLAIAMIFALGSLLAAFAPDFWLLLAARLILGLAVGASSSLCPVYLSELAPAEIRGRLVTANQVTMTLGILVSYVVDLALSGSGNWRAMFGAGFVVAVLMVLGLFAVPESPAWLAGRGREDRARKVLAGTTDPDTVERTLDDYRKDEQDDSGEQASARELLRSSTVRPIVLVGLVLAALQQFAGINALLYYAPTIMESTGLDASNALIYSIIIGAINLIMTVIATALTDRAGRRTLLLISLSGMLVASVPLGWSFLGLSGQSHSVVALISMLVYIAAFGLGLGPVFWLVNSEIYPPFARAQAAALATMVNWLANFAVNQAFLPLAGLIGQGWTFWVFGAVCLVGLIFVAKYVPETRGRSPQQIEDDLRERVGATT